MWSISLHILFVTLPAKLSTCAQLHYFHKMQNAMLILSQDTQERIAQNCSCDKSFSLEFSFSPSLALLSRSLALFFSASLSFTQSLPLSASIYPPFLHNETRLRHGITDATSFDTVARHLMFVLVKLHYYVRHLKLSCKIMHICDAPRPGLLTRYLIFVVALSSHEASPDLLKDEVPKNDFVAQKTILLSLVRCLQPNSWQRSLTRRLKFHEVVHMQNRKFYSTTTKRV